MTCSCRKCVKVECGIYEQNPTIGNEIHQDYIYIFDRNELYILEQILQTMKDSGWKYLADILL